MTAGRLADKIGRIVGDEDRGAAVSDQRDRHRALAPNDLDCVGASFRIVGGIGVGVASVIAPAYIAETSPPRIRGRLGSLQQLAIVTGIFLSLAIDYSAGAYRPAARDEELWLGLEAWRWMFIMMAIPGHPLRRARLHDSRVAALSGCPPYRFRRPARCLSMLLGEKNLEMTITRIQETLEREDKPSWRDLRKPTRLLGLYGIVWVGLGLSVFQQFVGINVIFYYSNVLWEAVGFDESQSSSSR